MNALKTACAAGALVFASLTSAVAAPASDQKPLAFPGTNGRWIYDGRTPPRCDIFDIRQSVRHFDGDGHVTGHEHLGHGHTWRKRGLKGRAIKPPCYVRRAGDLGASASHRRAANLALPAARRAAAIRPSNFGDLS